MSVDRSTPRAAAAEAASALEGRASASRLGKSLYRETDRDIIVMREAARAIRALLDGGCSDRVT